MKCTNLSAWIADFVPHQGRRSDGRRICGHARPHRRGLHHGHHHARKQRQGNLHDRRDEACLDFKLIDDIESEVPSCARHRSAFLKPMRSFQCPGNECAVFRIRLRIRLLVPPLPNSFLPKRERRTPDHVIRSASFRRCCDRSLDAGAAVRITCPERRQRNRLPSGPVPCGVAVTLLKLADELVFLPVDLGEIVVGEVAPLLLHLACELRPLAFQGIPVHHRSPPVQRRTSMRGPSGTDSFRRPATRAHGRLVRIDLPLIGEASDAPFPFKPGNVLVAFHFVKRVQMSEVAAERSQRKPFSLNLVSFAESESAQDVADERLPTEEIRTKCGPGRERKKRAEATSPHPLRGRGSRASTPAVAFAVRPTLHSSSICARRSSIACGPASARRATCSSSDSSQCGIRRTVLVAIVMDVSFSQHDLPSREKVASPGGNSADAVTADEAEMVSSEGERR